MLTDSLEIEGSIFKEKNLMFGVGPSFFMWGPRFVSAVFLFVSPSRVGGLEEKTAAILFIYCSDGFYDRAVCRNSADPFFPAFKIAGHLQYYQYGAVILAVSLIHGKFPRVCFDGCRVFHVYHVPDYFFSRYPWSWVQKQRKDPPCWLWQSWVAQYSLLSWAGCRI